MYICTLRKGSSDFLKAMVPSYLTGRKENQTHKQPGLHVRLQAHLLKTNFI